MKNTLVLVLVIFCLQACNPSKKQYLFDNRFDLHSDTFSFPEKEFNVLGFGAYHGSAKTEAAELNLLKTLTHEGLIHYYFPEVDYCTAQFYNDFLETGDSVLLRELITYNGYHVPQERTIEVYEKWKQLKQWNDQLPESKKIKVLGSEWIINYRFVSRYLLEINPTDKSDPIFAKISQQVKLDTASFNRGETSYVSQLLRELVTTYESDKTRYDTLVVDPEEFAFVIDQIKSSFMEQRDREKLLYENFLALDSRFHFDQHPAFFRIGFFHLEKSREGAEGYAPFFTRLIENEMYSSEEVISIIGYFTDSEVVWDEQYDDHGEYTGFTIEGGYGIGDYEKEYFRGIQHLKDAKISDQTLFRLNLPDSPYRQKEPDLIEVIMTDEESNGEDVKDMATTDYLDYAVLISDSKASRPIYEMK